MSDINISAFKLSTPGSLSQPQKADSRNGYITWGVALFNVNVGYEGF